MYSTHFRPEPSPVQRLVAWLSSPDLVRAVGLSLLVGASMTVAVLLGHLPAHAVETSRPQVVIQYVDVVPATPDGWAADDTANGTAPDRAH